jgi:uncharacterized protein (TIGR00266 family)
MKAEVEGKPSFGFVKFVVEPGERLMCEAGSMVAMSPGLALVAKMRGGWLTSLLRKFLGEESFFLNEISNTTAAPLEFVCSPTSPGEVFYLAIQNNRFWLREGAYLCSRGDVGLRLRFAGLKSWIAREGLFRWELHGTGEVWISSYGGVVEQVLDGETLVDSGHVVAFTEDVKMNLQLIGSLWTSVTSGEGFVMRLSGRGRVWLQTRSLDGFADWLKAKI